MCKFEVWAVSTSMSRTLPARLRRRARARRTRRSLRLESRRKAWVAASKRRVWVRRSWTWSGVGRLGAFFTSLRNLRTVFWMRSGFKDINFPCLELDAVGERRIAGHELIVSVPRRSGKPQGCEDSALRHRAGLELYCAKSRRGSTARI